uniref:NADH-ubiquinone oxidoreductase chain 2 n=1 Tax=Gynaikothrips ficorum TaxID=59752 RepID=A0A7M1LBY4_GYNFI|nr:NADH dehydrogenase subunit 2 [Gynaikothrips ficorum]QOQ85875.1 NADH dehydrogenase subunit 2 [Gynaikothrips ficorum]
MYFKKKNYFLNLCLFFMMFGVYLGLNSTSWIMMWLSMEITMMFFVPYLMLNKSMMESFSCLKYFIFQCLGSIFFILGSFDFFILNSFGLMLKLGLFPNHFWMLSVSKSLNWYNFFLIMTVQKILPLMFLFISLKFILKIFMFLFFINSFIGNLGSMNQMDLRMLMVFSSMNHISWMILSSIFNMIYFYIYFFFYSLLMVFLYLLFNKSNIFYMYQIFYMKSLMMKYNHFIIFMMFFSFMGFPPLLGFFMKMMSLISMSMIFYFFIIFFMIIHNLIISFSYMRLMIFFFMNVSRSLKMTKFNMKKYFNLMNISMYMFLI